MVWKGALDKEWIGSSGGGSRRCRGGNRGRGACTGNGGNWKQRRKRETIFSELFHCGIGEERTAYQYTMKHTMSRACLALASCLAIPLHLHAQGVGRTVAQEPRDSTSRDPHAVQPERPTVATHAGTVARGWVELEEGAEWDKAADGVRSFVAPTNLKIGLASRAQLNLLVNLIRDPVAGGSFGVGDLTIGLKYRV